MIGDRSTNSHHTESVIKLDRTKRNIPQAQETIYNFLLEIVKKWPPEDVLVEFKHLFIHHVDTVSSNTLQSLYEIVFSNNEEEFKNTLKRSCYILVNNWDSNRHYGFIKELVDLFSDPIISRPTLSPTLKRLRGWLSGFVASKDYQELKLFASRHNEGKVHWSQRYTSYLLVPQYIDLTNPIEQREAARALSKQLKDRFKFDLAMYTARSQSARSREKLPRNPTALGDEVLRFVKMIVARRGPFSYSNLANIFANQVQQLSYWDFKQSLREYLIFSVENPEFVETLKSKLTDKLNPLYASYHDEAVNSALLLRTCNRIIEYLTTEDRQEPSSLFVLLLSQGNPLTLVVVLLKIILICKYARTHLEARIADLIQYYEAYPEEECQWVVNFFEIFNITFAIYAENVEYNLIKMKSEGLDGQVIINLDSYRVFSQLKSSNADFEDYSMVLESELLEDVPSE